MPERYLITVDSFGENCPDNWEEIAGYLNFLLEEAWNEGCYAEAIEFKDVVETIWDKYCNGMLPDAPEAK